MGDFSQLTGNTCIVIFCELPLLFKSSEETQEQSTNSGTHNRNWISCLLAKGMSQFWLFHNDISFQYIFTFFSNEIKVVFNLWKYQYFIHLATKSSTRLNFWQQQTRICKEKMTDRFDIKNSSLSSFINLRNTWTLYLCVLVAIYEKHLKG